MGREQRNKEEKRKYRKTVPMRCLKAIVTILAIPVLVPFLLAQVAFEEKRMAVGIRVKDVTGV